MAFRDIAEREGVTVSPEEGNNNNDKNNNNKIMSTSPAAVGPGQDAGQAEG